MVKEGRTSSCHDVGIYTRVPDATRKSGFKLTGDVQKFDEVAPQMFIHHPVMPGGVKQRSHDIVSLMKNTLLARKLFINNKG